MTRKELIQEIRNRLTEKYAKIDGTLDYTEIRKDTEVQHNQVKAFFDTAKNPGINLICAFCDALNLKISIEEEKGSQTVSQSKQFFVG